jgi:hypothetical protein
MLKSLYTISHFAMLVVMMDFLVLFFWRFIFIHYISYAEKKKKKLLPYALQIPLDFTTIFYYKSILNIYILLINLIIFS